MGVRLRGKSRRSGVDAKRPKTATRYLCCQHNNKADTRSQSSAVHMGCLSAAARKLDLGAQCMCCQRLLQSYLLGQQEGHRRPSTWTVTTEYRSQGFLNATYCLFTVHFIPGIRYLLPAGANGTSSVRGGIATVSLSPSPRVWKAPAVADTICVPAGTELKIVRHRGAMQYERKEHSSTLSH